MRLYKSDLYLGGVAMLKFAVVCFSLVFVLPSHAEFSDEMARVINFSLNPPTTLQRLRGDYDPKVIPSPSEIQNVMGALTDAISIPSFAVDTPMGRINRDFLNFERDDFPLAPDLTKTNVMDEATQKELQTRLMVYLAKLPQINNRKALAVKLCENIPGELPVRRDCQNMKAWRDDLAVLSLLVDMRNPDPIQTPIQKIWHKAKRCGKTLLREILDDSARS